MIRKTMAVALRLCLVVLTFGTLASSVSSVFASELQFFSPTGYSDQYLEEISDSLGFDRYVEEFDLTEVVLSDRIDSVDGFCVTDDFIYIADQALGRVNVYTKDFQKVHTIRRGSPEDLFFSPKGLSKDSEGNLYVLTDIANSNGIGRVHVFNREHTFVHDISFKIQRPDKDSRMGDLAVMDDGEIYFTVNSDDPQLGKVYHISPQGEAMGIGNESFGHLCPSLDGLEVLFVNGQFMPDVENRGQKGMSALYRISYSTITAMAQLPAILCSPLTSAQMELFDETLACMEKPIPDFDKSDFFFSASAAFGYSDLTRIGNEYYALISYMPAILVFDAQLKYSRTIKLMFGSSWDPVKSLEHFHDEIPVIEQVVWMDADASGDLYMLAVSATPSSNRVWSGLHAVKKP